MTDEETALLEVTPYERQTIKEALARVHEHLLLLMDKHGPLRFTRQEFALLEDTLDMHTRLLEQDARFPRSLALKFANEPPDFRRF